MNLVYLNLGSNVPPYNTLSDCIRMLADRVEIIGVSSAYESPPMGSERDSGSYLNAAAAIRTEMGAQTLRDEVLRRIETQCGRDRADLEIVALDIDITAFNDQSFQLGKRPVPDPAIASQIHVALPLSEIAPEFVYGPTGESVSTIVKRLQREQKIELRRDIVLT